MAQEYYLVSTKHTKRKDKFFTLWMPDDRGYTLYQESAGFLS